MKEFSYTEYAAWVGAIVGLFTFFWNVYREHSNKSKLNINVKLKKGYFGEGILPHQPPFLIMSISNRGYSRTNLTSLDFLMYKNRWAKIINSPVQGNLVPREYFKLPHALESSDIWEDVVEIEPILKSVEQYGENLLYVYAWHELSKWPKVHRLDLKAILEVDREFQANKKQT